MAKAEATVEELVAMIERGEIRLPEMQRRYVWKAPRVRDLLDSLYRNYPSGAILLWETDETVPLQDFAVDQSESPYSSRRLLLDGQQRLTSLSAVIRGKPVRVRGRKKPIELLFNLEHPDELALVTEVEEEEDEDLTSDEMDSSEDELQRRFEKMTFLVATKKVARLPHWVNVSQVFRSESDKDFLRQAGVQGFDDPRYERYTRRLARLRGIRRYVYRMDVLERGLSYDEVTEIFVRVNSLGSKLRSSDLALAQITAKWRNSLKIFQSFEEHCKNVGFDLDLGIHLKNMVAFATGQSRFQTVGGLPRERLEAAWRESRDGMEFAINFLRSNAGIDSGALLSSPFLLITLSYFGNQCRYELTPEQSAALRYWALVANAKGRYSRGSSETFLDQDLATVRQNRDPQSLMERVKLQVGRVEIVPEELAGRNQRSAFFKTMFLAFRAAGAKDWQSDLGIALSHSGKRHKLQFHHIFPKAVLKQAAVPQRLIDDIANLSFISGRTNRKILNKEPAQYLAPLLEKRPAAFAAQCIPADPGLLQVSRYEDFLQARRDVIAQRLNAFLGMHDPGVIS